MSRTLLIGIALLVGAGRASAHPNTRGLVRMLDEPTSGRSVRLMWECGDGIFAVDPCKLLLHDEQGALLGETGMARITSWLCWSRSDCVAFAFHSWLPLLPDEVWRIRGGSIWLASNWWRPLGTAIHLWDHWYLYLPMLGLFFLPILLVRDSVWPRPVALRVVGLTIAIAVGGLFLLVWLYLAVVLLPLSLPLLVLLIALVVIVQGRPAGAASADARPAPGIYLAVGLSSGALSAIAWVVARTDLVEDSWRALAEGTMTPLAVSAFLVAMWMAGRAAFLRQWGPALLVAVPTLLSALKPLGALGLW